MGTPEFAVPTLDLLNKNYNVIGVFTQPPRKKNRGMKSEMASHIVILVIYIVLCKIIQYFFSRTNGPQITGGTFKQGTEFPTTMNWKAFMDHLDWL